MMVVYTGEDAAISTSGRGEIQLSREIIKGVSLFLPINGHIFYTIFNILLQNMTSTLNS